MPAPLSAAQRRFIEQARAAHLATVSAQGEPLVLPICFALHEQRLFSVLDAKPKRVEARRLERVRNLAAHPGAAVVVDRWDEDWSRLAWVHLRGPARLVEPGAAGADAGLQPLALRLLAEKYPQYRSMDLQSQPIIVMEIRTVRSWGML